MKIDREPTSRRFSLPLDMVRMSIVARHCSDQLFVELILAHREPCLDEGLHSFGQKRSGQHAGRVEQFCRPESEIMCGYAVGGVRFWHSDDHLACASEQ
jgi:hypothetical protein